VDDAQTTNAINELQSFVNEVNDCVSEDILTSAEGQTLLDEVDTVITLLGQKK
jgi:hypothetical protein